MNGGNQSEKHAREHAGTSRERQHSPVEQRSPAESKLKVESHAIRQRQVHRQQQLEERERQHEARRRAAEPEQRALHQHLARERASTGAEGSPHGDLLPPVDGAGHQKARQVGARQQQHQPHDGDQQPRRRAQERIHSRDDLHLGRRHELEPLSGNPPLRPRGVERRRHEGRGVLGLHSRHAGSEPRLDENAVPVNRRSSISMPISSFCMAIGTKKAGVIAGRPPR